MKRLRESDRARVINDFLRTPQYIILLCALTAFANVFALDLGIYTVLILSGVYICLMSDDFLPMMPIVMLCYIAPSVKNNPGRHGDSIFSLAGGGIVLIVLMVVFMISLGWRVVTDRDLFGKRSITQKRYLTIGMLLLGVAYLISGFFSEGYTDVLAQNQLFALVQFAAIFVLYFLFSATVDWSRAPRSYLAWVGMCVGLTVLPQLLRTYVTGQAFAEAGYVDRELIYTGWGMHNNIGGLMCMMMPFAYYLAYTQKKSWVYNLLGTVLMGGILLSCSRTAMAVGAVTYVVCAVILLRKKETRRENLWVYGIAAGLALLVAAVFFKKLLGVFALFIEEIDELSSRDKLVTNGIKKFLKDPVFGGSFFFTGGSEEYVPWQFSQQASFSSFFPPRWHNTIVQIGASCGVVGLAAYGFHRYQTVKLFWKQRSHENTFIAMFVGILLLCSLMDCHFFNVGPVLFYSMGLAYAENIHRSERA